MKIFTIRNKKRAAPKNEVALFLLNLKEINYTIWYTNNINILCSEQDFYLPLSPCQVSGKPV